jgi:predicted GNAT family acetyltransferase
MSVQVRDNLTQSRAEVFAGGQLAGFAKYRLHDGRITFFHTEIDPAHEGSGLGSRLALAALDDVRARGLPVVPQCPYIAGFIRRHPDQYLDLVVPEMRSKGSKLRIRISPRIRARVDRAEDVTV